MAGISAVRAAEIHWLPDAHPQAIEVSGLTGLVLSTGREREANSSAMAKVFSVFAEPLAGSSAEKSSLPPMAGTWRSEGDRWRFEPRFPLAHGVRYRAEFRPLDGVPVVSFFELPARHQEALTTVVKIFPTADTLPENQLKFYVHFSAPMSRGGTYDHVQVRDADGRLVDLPFLDLDEELWDRSMTRLTLLIDPGRIKRGVKPLEDMGPVFEQGKQYTLTLAASCRDANNQPLARDFVKTFRIGPADRTAPDPLRWRIVAPRAGSRDALRVEFDEPMDQALALRLIHVVAGKPAASIDGEPALEADERAWIFRPSQPWREGEYRLTVATTIEDLAGNNIGKTFDVDLSSGAERRVAATSVSVPFEVK